jgi:hypothetical protein
MPAPRWVRALLAIDRLFARMTQVEAVLRDELLLAAVPADRRDDITRAIYGREHTYVTGGAIFDRGLFSWEETLLEHAAIPRTGRVLVGGAGGGREVQALCERGYSVVAFEPAEALARSCATVAARLPNARVLRGSYRDLDAAREGRGPLAEVHDRQGYAFVLLGWRSLSHVLQADARRDLFGALAEIAPRAPIIASFATIDPTTRSRMRVRAALATLRSSSPAAGTPFFLPWAGFAVALDRDALHAATAPAGYSVAIFHSAPEGFALLLPS